MPFITKTRRKVIALAGLKGLDAIRPGDRCYVFYKPMAETWRLNPSWTTAHNIYMKMVKDFDTLTEEDDLCAYRMAWEVFFNLYVMPYEMDRRRDNGDI